MNRLLITFLCVPLVAAAAPTCSIATIPATLIAGQTGTLSASGSFGTGTLSYLWQELNGPTVVSFSSRSVQQPKITGLVYGTYTWQLRVTDTTGSTVCTASSQVIWTGTNQASDAARIRSSLVGYNVPSLLGNPPLLAAVSNYLANRFSLIFNPHPANLVQYNPNLTQTTYVDTSFISPNELPELITWAATNAYSYENLFPHMTADYTMTGGAGWSGMDQFDAFETTLRIIPGGAAVNGVYTLAGATYSDVTGPIYSGGSIQVTDKLLVGYLEPFALMKVVLTTPQSGKTIAWQYWNGSSYVALSLASDGTNGLTQNGTITFLPPSNWARHPENISQSKYWVRLVVTGAGGTAPVFNTLKGDDLQNGCVLCARGWSSTDSHRINVGLGNLEYNPNPPAGQSAKFKYQSRVLFGFSANNLYGNHGDVQNGTHRTWGEWLAHAAIIQTDEFPTFTSGLFLDDGASIPRVAANAFPALSDYRGGGATIAEFRADQIATIGTTANVVKSRYGANYLTLTNTDVMNFGLSAKGLFVEAAYSAAQIANGQYKLAKAADGTVEGSWSFDACLTANNPSNAVCNLMVFDNLFSGFTGSLNATNGRWHSWERGLRGPMAALSSYYIGSNSNTVFAYNTLGFSYFDNDDFWYYGASGSTTVALPANPLAATVTITGNFSNLVGLPPTTAIGCGSQIAVRLGTLGEATCVTVLDSNHLQTNFPTYNSYPAGTIVSYITNGHEATDNVPPMSQIFRWGSWFPAMGVDIGSPDPSGLNGGARLVPWVDAATNTGVGSLANSSITAGVYTIGAGGGAPWYNVAWTHRKRITFDRSRVSGSVALTNFPALISTTDSNLQASAQASGNDILFTASDGVTKLNHEIELYTNSSGQLLAWVNLPSLSPTSDTSIYMYYGNPSASDQQNKTAVWDSNYKMVQHLTNATALDSTSNGRNGTVNGPASVTGQIGTGASFSNSSHNIQFSNPLDNGSVAMSLSFWVFRTGNSAGAIFSNHGTSCAAGPSQDGYNAYVSLLGAGSVDFDYGTNGSGCNGFDTAAGQFPLNTWTYIALTGGGVYVNGILVSGSAIQNHNTSSTNLRVGQTVAGTVPFSGRLDELRISFTTRSSDWIATEFNNQSNPATFEGFGFPEDVGGGGGGGGGGGAGGIGGPNQVISPILNPPPGTYAETQTVELSTPTPGALIRYTTSGVDPTPTAGTLYTGTPVTIGSSTTFKAIAYVPACSPSLICADVWRRDFTKAVVIVRPYCGAGCHDGELDLPGKPLALGGTLYPLLPDGTTGEPVTSLQLRAGEGAVLMRQARTPVKTIKVAIPFQNAPLHTTSFQAVVTKPDNSQITVSCSASPCSVASGRSGIHLVKWNYLDSSGKVLATSESTPIPFQ